MRKILFRTSTIVIVLLLMVLACQKDKLNQSATTENDDATSMSVAEAKTWFEANKQPDMVFKDGNLKEIKKIGIKPDWGSGATSKNSDIEVVETGLQVQGSFGFADEPSYSQWNVNKDNTLISSVTRMVFMKNKKSGKIDQFLMTIVGNKEYHDNNAGQLVGNTYLKRNQHFSGHIYYHDLAGNFVNGWKYEKGKLVAESTQTTGDVLPIHLKSATCSTYAIYTIYVNCTDWYVNGIWDRESCGAPYAVETGSYDDCMINPPGVPGSKKTGVEGGYNPPAPPAPPCDCVNVCNVCGGCLDTNQLKSAGINCPGPCTCPKIVEDPSFKGDVKVQCVFSNLIKTATTSYNPIVTSFLVNFSDGVTIDPGDIYFSLGPIPANNGTISYGECVKDITNDKFYVTLNVKCINNRSSIEIAHTFIHEILHAQLGHGISTNTDSFVDLFRQYILTDNQGYSYSNDHQLMLDNYVAPMVEFLKDYDHQNGFSADEKYYRSLALSGLKDVGSINLTAQEMNDIWEAEAYFRARGLNCQ